MSALAITFCCTGSGQNDACLKRYRVVFPIASRVFIAALLFGLYSLVSPEKLLRSSLSPNDTNDHTLALSSGIYHTSVKDRGLARCLEGAAAAGMLCCGSYPSWAIHLSSKLFAAKGIIGVRATAIVLQFCLY